MSLSGYIHLRIIWQYTIGRFSPTNLQIVYLLSQVNRQLNELSLVYLSTIPDFRGCKLSADGFILFISKKIYSKLNYKFSYSEELDLADALLADSSADVPGFSEERNMIVFLEDNWLGRGYIYNYLRKITEEEFGNDWNYHDIARITFICGLNVRTAFYEMIGFFIYT